MPRGRCLVIQKASQLGLTVWEVLADMYMALKWAPVNIGLFLPDIATASAKSSNRFMPVVRSVPELLRHLSYRREIDGTETRVGEGNILTRPVGSSLLMFLWTTGKTSTESNPYDVVSLDEVQNMTLPQIEKVLMRLGDSPVGFKLMLSTANMPDLDINYWYGLGTQEVWHTECLACGEASDLSDPIDNFPAKAIAYNTGQVPRSPSLNSLAPPRVPHNEYVWTLSQLRPPHPRPTSRPLHPAAQWHGQSNDPVLPAPKDNQPSPDAEDDDGKRGGGARGGEFAQELLQPDAGPPLH